MAEYKKEISIAGTVAVIAALGVGLLAITAFPNDTGTTYQPVDSLRVLLGYVSARDVNCSLATGSCTMTLLNNSTVPLMMTGCQMNLILSTNGTSTTWHRVNGTVGGPAAAGILAGRSYAQGSGIPGSCTVATSELSHEMNGSRADGLFFVKLANNWYNFPPGTWAIIGIDGFWS